MSGRAAISLAAIKIRWIRTTCARCKGCFSGETLAGTIVMILRKRMGAAFLPCLQTEIWDVFARTGANIEGCKAL